jgi:hypothetical protein
VRHGKVEIDEDELDVLAFGLVAVADVPNALKDGTVGSRVCESVSTASGVVLSLGRKGEQNSQATITSPVFQMMLDRITLTPVVAFVTRTTSSVLALIVSASVSRT